MDLIAATRTKILNAVDSIQPKSGYKTVVLDAAGKRMLSLVMETHVLLDRRCANVMDLESKRNTENYFDVIYIIEPTEFSAECIAADYSRSPPRYAQAHVFMLGESSRISKMIANGVGRFLGSLQVADFSVLPLESRVFSFGDPYATDLLYNRNIMLDIKYVNRMANRIFSMVAPFGVDPVIRYWNPATSYAKSELPKIMAEMLGEKFTVAAQEGAQSPVRTQILILDRSVDQFSPVLHEFTLQALAYDLLKFEDNTLSTGGVLDDKDTEWLALRHSHISYAIEELTQRVAQLKAANPHFGKSDGQVKVSDIRNMMAALPDFVKSKDSMAVNLQVATDCMDTVEKNQLMLVADLEQALALDSDADGKRLGPETTDKLIGLLGSPTLHKDIKLRLLMVYVLSRGSGLFATDYNLLRHHAKLEPYELEMIQNLAVWGTPTIKQQHAETKNPQFASDNTEEQYLYARYTPGLKNILSMLLAGQLDAKLFPTLGEKDTNDPTLTATNSLRNPKQRATWARPAAGAVQRPKIFVFMLGGFTAAERRSVYELSATAQRDIAIGGPDELTPAKYLRFLARQGLAREYLGLPQDQPPKKAPKYLYEGDSRAKAPVANSASAGPAAAPAPAPASTGAPAPTQNTTPLINPKEKEKKKLRFFKR